MTEKTPLHARSEAEAVAFALPRDRLPWPIRASNQFGRIVIGHFHARERRRTRACSEAGRAHPRLEPQLERGPDPHRQLAHVEPGPAGPLDGQGGGDGVAVAGPFIRMNGAFGIRRGAPDTEAFRLAKSVLDEGRVLGTFPEGTRSPTGGLQRARTA